MGTIQDSEPCGWIAPHEEHVHGFMWMQFSCPGIPRGTEYRLTVRGIKRWSQIRDEIAPAFRRDFPGVLVIADERVITLSYPDPNAWRGASLELLGLEYKTAESIQSALVATFGLWDSDKYPEIHMLTDEEISRVREHRA